MTELDGYRRWLVRRGRSRSADQYCRVVGRWLNDKAGVQRLLTSGSHSPNYRRHLTACLRSWATYAHDGKMMAHLGDIKQPPPTPITAREPLSIEEWQEVRRAVTQSDLTRTTREVCNIVATRGIRCGDVLRLGYLEIQRAVNSGSMRYQSKGERWLTVNAEPIREHLEALLGERWPSARSRVRNLVSPDATHDTAQDTAGRAIRRAFDRIAVAVGMEPRDLYAHRFRHTYATRFLQHMEGDPEAVFKLQQQMGWARLETAAHYLRRDRRSELDDVEKRMLEDPDA